MWGRIYIQLRSETDYLNAIYVEVYTFYMKYKKCKATDGKNTGKEKLKKEKQENEML